MKDNATINLGNDDFGFSFMGEEEIKSIRVEDAWRGRLETAISTIMPLLIRLKKDPEKDFIKWPNRVPKIDEIIFKLNELKETPIE